MRVLVNGRFIQSNHLHAVGVTSLVLLPEDDPYDVNLDANGDHELLQVDARPVAVAYKGTITLGHEIRRRREGSALRELKIQTLLSLESGKNKPKPSLIALESLGCASKRLDLKDLRCNEIDIFEKDQCQLVVSRLPKQEHFEGKVGPLLAPDSIEELVEQSIDAKQISASFSTMMRFLNKRSSVFSWGGEEETVVSLVAGKTEK